MSSSTQKYVPKFRRTPEEFETYKQLQVVNKNKEITEEFAQKYIYSRKYEKLETIDEDKEF